MLPYKSGAFKMFVVDSNIAGDISWLFSGILHKRIRNRMNVDVSFLIAIIPMKVVPFISSNGSYTVPIVWMASLIFEMFSDTGQFGSPHLQKAILQKKQISQGTFCEILEDVFFNS